MTQVTIHLTRHGEVHNPEGILYGRIDGFGLSERGRRMAERLAEHYSGSRGVRALVCSPLQRAEETIAPIAAALELAPRTDERVIEAANDFEGTRVDGSALSRPQNLAKVYNPFRPSWGEPYLEQVKRMRAAIASLRTRLESLAADADLEAVEGIIVSHQLPIWVTRLAAEQKPLWHDPRRRECALASVTSFTYESGTLVDVEYEDVCADLQPEKAVSGA